MKQIYPKKFMPIKRDKYHFNLGTIVEVKNTTHNYYI